MKSIYRRSQAIILSLLVLAATGCKKFLDPGRPPTQIQTSEVFTSDESAISSVTGLYGEMGNSLSLASGAESLYGALSADELITTGPNAYYEGFNSNSLVADNMAIYGNFWSPVYGYIYHINAVLAGLENSSLPTPGLKSQLKGQLLITRAAIYFYLNSFFGNVPLITSTDYEINAGKPAATTAAIKEQIVRDLTEAETLIGDQYHAILHTLPEKLTATSLLARVYLYHSQWTEAEAKATEIINSGMFRLEEDLTAVFESVSGETIWQIARDNGNTTLAQYLLPFDTGELPTFALRDEFLDGMEPGDQRTVDWVAISTVDGQDYPYPYKYRTRNNSPISEYYILMRLAELYLIRAEARAEQDNLSGSLEDVNLIRERAGLADIALVNKEDILTAIAQERKAELFAEGHRWLDLKRTKKADTVIGNLKGASWQATDTLYPIPLSQINLNPSLIQNPGY